MEIMYILGLSVVGSIAYGIFKITNLTGEVESRLKAERQQYNYYASQRAYIQQQTLAQEFEQYKLKYISFYGSVSIED